MKTNEQKQEMTEIIIDLKEIMSGDLILSKENSMIHYLQLYQVCKILEERIEQAKDYNPSNKFISQNDVISIFARRGAGKTTFIKSLVNIIRNSNESFFNEINSKLCCLDVFEPNQMSNKENIMIRFIAQIQEKFQNYDNEKEICIKNIDKSNIFHKAKQDLYESLRVIDGIGDTSLYSNWDDSAYLADRYMELTMKMKELECRFHKYIAAGLNLMNKDALLFVLDDTDVNIEKSFQILEIIRLYFTSPQIIVMMTGDAALYGMAVRRNYWHFFEKDFLMKEDISSTEKIKCKEYQNMIYRLETQYMQKMIKVDHRIFLNNLYDKFILNEYCPKSEKISIKIKLQNFDSKIEEVEYVEIHNLYYRIFKELKIFLRNKNMQMKYINYMLTQPLRNQLRLFWIYNQYFYAKSQDITYLILGILKVFETDINQNSSDTKFLMAHTPIYPAWLLKFLLENKILQIGSGFLPETENDNLNNTLIALGISCTEQINHNKYIILDYWLRLSLTRQLIEFVHIEKNIQCLIDFAHLYADKGICNMLNQMLVYSNYILCKNSKINITVPGVFAADNYIYTQNHSLIGDLIQLLQLRTISSDASKYNLFSSYRLLAFIGEILRNDYNFKSEKKASNQYKYINNLFQRHIQIRTYTEPDNQPSFAFEKEKEGYSCDQYITGSDSSNYNEFLQDIVNWYNDFNTKLFNASPYFIDNIFKRFFHTLCNMPSFFSLGDKISYMIIALWNSALVETFIVSNRSSKVELDYNNNINLTFFNNYTQSLLYNLKNDTLVIWLIRCPLLRKYVNPFLLTAMENLIIHRKKFPKDVIKIKKDIEDFTIDDYKLVFEKEESKNKAEILNEDIEITEAKLNKQEEKISSMKKYHKLQDFINNQEERIDVYKRQITKMNVSITHKEEYLSIIENCRMNILKAEEEMSIIKNTYEQEEDSFDYLYPASMEDALQEKRNLEIELKDKKIEKEKNIEKQLTDKQERLYKKIKSILPKESVYTVLNKCSKDIL